MENPKYSTWEKNDQFLKTCLTRTMTEEPLSLVIGLDTSKQVWEYLVDTFIQSTKDSKVMLRGQLQMCKKGIHTVDEYVQAFKKISDDLTAIQSLVNDKDKVFYLSSGLGSQYESFVTSMLSKPPYPTYSQFVIALRSHELRNQCFAKEKHQSFIDPIMTLVGQLQENQFNKQGYNSGQNYKSYNGAHRGYNGGQSYVGGTGRGGHGRSKGYNNNRQNYNSQGRGFAPLGIQQFRIPQAI